MLSIYFLSILVSLSIPIHPYQTVEGKSVRTWEIHGRWKVRSGHGCNDGRCKLVLVWLTCFDMFPLVLAIFVQVLGRVDFVAVIWSLEVVLMFQLYMTLIMFKFTASQLDPFRR